MLFWRYKLLSVLRVCFVIVFSQQLQADPISCLSCHNASSDIAVHAIFKTAHGVGLGKGDDSCIACHGDSKPHSSSPVSIAPDVSFGPRWPAEPDTRSSACQGCHQKGPAMLWTGSAHQQEKMSCDSCHTSHRQQDSALNANESVNQCMSCHPRTRAEAKLPSHHPILEGKTVCTDCHNPHGSMGESGLIQPSINDNCYSCHQEKRGPFLWEHTPVTEDCTLCHRSHGAVNDRLLITRGPAQCQQCHAVAFHPSLPYGAQGLPSNIPNQNLLGKNCLNCHGQIHGSNHPSGTRFTR